MHNVFSVRRQFTSRVASKILVHVQVALKLVLRNSLVLSLILIRNRRRKDCGEMRSRLYELTAEFTFESDDLLGMRVLP